MRRGQPSLAALGLLACMALVFVGCSNKESSPPTVEDAIAAVTRPRQVYYQEMEFTFDNGNSHGLVRAWYSPSRAAGRVEYIVNDEIQQVDLTAGSRQVTADVEDNHTSEQRVDSIPEKAPNAGILVLQHISAWLAPSGGTVPEATESDGVPAWHVTSSGPGYPGSEEQDWTFTYDLYLRRDTLLPIRLTVTGHPPESEAVPWGDYRAVRTEFLDEAAVPAELFDADRLLAGPPTPRR